MFRLIEKQKATLKVGDFVTINRDIWDDGQDCHPPGVLAKSGDQVIIVSPPMNDGSDLWVRHQGARGQFLVHIFEIGRNQDDDE